MDQTRDLVSVLTSAAPGLLDREGSAGSLSSFAAVQPYGLSSNAETAAIELPAEVTEAIPMGSAGVGLASQPAEELGEAIQLQHNVVAFVGDNLTQVAVDRGAREYTLATIINSPEAGESFTYDVHSTDQVRIELGESGGAFFVAGDNVVGGVLAPWAVDADGVEVPTRYAVKDGALVQIVEHIGGGYAYPIVADPTYYGESLIDRVVTRTSKKGRELSVYTTTWWRVAATGVGITQQVRWQVTDEFARRVPSPWDTTGSRQQVSCHAWWAQSKYPWNIELWRPTVGEAATAAAGCNPNP